jgi:hypothetical protein
VLKDFFICHATEDKTDVARPLAELLVASGFTVWLDEYELRVGDSLRGKIDEGIASSRFGVVIVSPRFFQKDWPQREVDGMVARGEGPKGIRMLPVWHNIRQEEVVANSPTLAGIVAAKTSDGLDRVVEQLTYRLRTAEGQPSTGDPSQLNTQDVGDHIVAMASTPSGYGYWILTSSGSVHCWGDAGFYGSLEAIILNAPVVDLVATPTGYGYWILGADGGIFAFGDARFYGSAGSVRLAAPMVRMVKTPTGGGYWLIASDGRLFAFGDARLFPLRR